MNSALADIKFGAHVARADIDNATATAADGWWGQVGDSSDLLGVSASYRLLPFTDIRALYEIGDTRVTNVCPPDTTCTTIAITEQNDVTNAALMLEPELPIFIGWQLYGNLGYGQFKVKSGNELPGISETGAIVGAGIRNTLLPFAEFSLEYQQMSDVYSVVRLGVAIRF